MSRVIFVLKFFWVSLLAVGVLGCEKKVDNNSTAKAVFGDNNAIDVPGSSELSQILGYLTTIDNKVLCNGYFNSPTTIITAKHCLKEYESNTLEKEVSFATASKTYALKKVVQSWDNADILEVMVEGDNPKYQSNAPLSDEKIEIYYYDANKTLKMMAAAAFVDNHDGTIYHQMDTAPSSSGSVIIQKGKAVAVHVGALYSDTSKSKALQNVASQLTTLSSATYGTLVHDKNNIVREKSDAEIEWCLMRVVGMTAGCAGCLVGNGLSWGSLTGVCGGVCQQMVANWAEAEKCKNELTPQSRVFRPYYSGEKVFNAGVAYPAGSDANGSTTYICRVTYRNELYTGWFLPQNQVCYFGGSDQISNYMTEGWRILEQSGLNGWIPSNSYTNPIPRYAVQVEQTILSRGRYICRAIFFDHWVTGTLFRFGDDGNYRCVIAGTMTGNSYMTDYEVLTHIPL